MIKPRQACYFAPTAEVYSAQEYEALAAENERLRLERDRLGDQNVNLWARLAYVDELLTLLHRTEDEKIALRIEVTDEMVTRFLWWRLPDDFQPDGGITFNRFVGCQPRPPEWWPVGTNLLTAVQAKAMLQHVLADQPHDNSGNVIVQANLASTLTSHPFLSPTHACVDCGALWRQCDDFSMNLRSPSCCDACNNAPVGPQIRPLYVAPTTADQETAP